MKKFFIITGIIIAVLGGAVLVSGIVLYRQPAVKFLMVMSEFKKSTDVTRVETTIRVKDRYIPYMIFTPKHAVPGKYYFLLHGFTPESYKHPTIIKVAHAIAEATGRTVFIPHISGSVEGVKSIPFLSYEVLSVYQEIKKKYPGRYNAFGACVAGTGLLVSFNLLSPGEYPDKLFLFGPFFTGQMLLDFYNKAGITEVDYLVKMASALNTDRGVYSKEERAIIKKAIIASKPGTTDRNVMRSVLGDPLFQRIDEAKIDNRQFAQIDELKIFSKGKKIPNSEFYIIHSTTDDIIPYTMGYSLHKFLLNCGVRSRFVATNLFGHSQNKMTFLGYYQELKDMIGFLNDLFEDKE